MPFFRKRTIWWPTWLGVGCLFAITAGSALLWWFKGEAFLATTSPAPADVLVVEGWIGGPGIRVAAAEFARGGYRVVVATGALTGERWYDRRWSNAEYAEQQLLRSGIAPDRIILAPSGDTEAQRTFQMAVTVRRALLTKNLHPAAINVFTRGSHGRRSRLVYAKVFGSDTQVGIISWMPPGYETEPWWHSSERAGDIIKESVAYLFEVFLNSGRWDNAANADAGIQEAAK